MDDMVVPDNDDDIIEDYDELPEVTSDTRRVKSATGGPVDRPGDDAPPGASLNGRPDKPLGPPSKGKISHSTARTIWIVCILIILLGIGAVVADYQFNAFGRHKDAPDKAQQTPDPVDRPGRNQPDLSPREKLEREFQKDVVGQIHAMEYSKAWDFYWLSVLEFEDAYDEARKFHGMDDYETEERDAAIALALKHYYKARYAEDLFKHHYDSGSALGVELKDLGGLEDEELERPELRTSLAAAEKISTRASGKLRTFSNDMLGTSVTDNVQNSEKWRDEVFGEWKSRFEAGRQGEFAQEDLEFVQGDDYAQDEQRMYEKYLADKRE